MSVWTFAKETGINYGIEILERKNAKTKRKDLISQYDAQIKRLKGLK